MMNIFSKYLASILVALVMWGCITPYDPPTSESGSGILVVSGIITNGETSIVLSRSTSIATPNTGPPVRNAKIWVESEDGDRFDAVAQTPAQQDAGEYIVPVGELRLETRYRLRITASGGQYESEWRPVQDTPAIEKVDVFNNTEKGVMQVRVGLRGDEDQPRYYRWSYEENWESHALVDVTSLSGASSKSPTYYCWHRNFSGGMFLGNTAKMKENTLIDHVVYEFGYDDFRLFYLYHTKLVQQSLTEEAYTYYESQKKNSEEMGSIFAPLPSEMAGNIVCTSHPDIRVIGFIEASIRRENEASLLTDFRPPYIFPLPPNSPNTSIHTYFPEDYAELGKSNPELYEKLILVYREGSEGPMHFVDNPQCLDCRLPWIGGMGGGGTKNKPAWWPNDHQ